MHSDIYIYRVYRISSTTFTEQIIIECASYLLQRDPALSNSHIYLSRDERDVTYHAAKSDH